MSQETLNAYALIIGIGNYRHIPQLKKATTDAQDLRDVLVQGGYPESQVSLLLDDQATTGAISDRLDWLTRRAQDEATVLIFFAGHGAQRVGGFDIGEYLCPVEADWYNLSDTAISNQMLTRALNAIKAERVAVFLDACHSGGVGEARGALSVKEGLSTDTYDQLSAGKGRIVIASSQPDEVSWELDGMRNGLFTHYLLEGLRGKVADEDGGVRALRLFSYLSQQVPQHKSQHPLLKTAEASADIMLCQIPAGVVEPPPSVTPPVETPGSTTTDQAIDELPEVEPSPVKPSIESTPPEPVEQGPPAKQPPPQPGPPMAVVDPSTDWDTNIPPSDHLDKEGWIGISLSAREWTLDVDQTAFFELTITNGGNLVAEFNVQIKGLPPEWLMLSTSQIVLNPGQSETLTGRITPPRIPDSRAGTSHFAVVVTSPEYAQDDQNRPRYGQLGATLTINPYYQFEVTELVPRVQTTTWRERTGFTEFEIINQGNADTHFRIQSADLKQQCSFEFALPGETTMLASQADLLIPLHHPRQTVGVQITPVSRRLLSFRQDNYPFIVTITPGEDQVGPLSLAGELKNKPLFGPMSFAVMSLVFLLLIVEIFRPGIALFTAEPQIVQAGTPVTLHWNVSRFANPRINQNVGALDEPAGSATAIPIISSAAETEVVYTLRATNWLSNLFRILEAE